MVFRTQWFTVAFKFRIIIQRPRLNDHLRTDVHSISLFYFRSFNEKGDGRWTFQHENLFSNKLRLRIRCIIIINKKKKENYNKHWIGPSLRSGTARIITPRQSYDMRARATAGAGKHACIREFPRTRHVLRTHAIMQISSRLARVQVRVQNSRIKLHVREYKPTLRNGANRTWAPPMRKK